MSRLVKLLLLFVLFTLSIGMLAAQDEPLPNDPHVNLDANACCTGGSMEGKCGDSEYLWAGAWYKIRYDYGLISRNIFPDQYKWMLPSLEEEAAKGATCTIDIGGPNASALGMSSSIVQVPLAVINGGSDPDATYGATPYGFDWYGGATERALNLYGPSAISSMTLWYQDSVTKFWNSSIVSNTCPTPTPP